MNFRALWKGADACRLILSGPVGSNDAAQRVRSKADTSNLYFGLYASEMLGLAHAHH